MKQIGQYYYTYGAGAHPNRKLEFFRESNSHQIEAESFAWEQSSRDWVKIGTVSGNAITFESKSTTDKVNEMMRARTKNQPYQLPDPEPIQDLHRKQIDLIFKELEPDGPYRLEITNGIGPKKFEKIERINIFNPS